ncbi:peptide chain release factor N(5)-glutamine methyltransferase [Nosocomiicoccus ampullae]|uniref:Release factor glutamine methyltransferase n=1 Tax=Nosocomiicoccus ampullae TaxID=489910 RepID=A0A9Q2CZD2_9STAP|nr:peptide chain release factor N(5)-glutamine methyltransferase [Nosocomiicoccus ampullae]MBB5176043.1 release factor glutamine methyltransferase [Nosocomiicoccus ampullae]QYA46636.1 peptide chain release factor N(5)-glutamine methyltransferase [Nosocomiicoccus ampullae]
MPSFNAALSEAKKTLSLENKEPRIVDILMEDLFSMDTVSLLVNGHKKMDEKDYKLFLDSIKRALNDEPVQYITGVQHFYGRIFNVTRDTLIPRNETEELVELVLNRTKGGTVADIGTGTGAIGISLKLENDAFKVYLTDVSKDALKVAKSNKEKLDANVEILHGDLFEPIVNRNIKVDVLVSNPPYIDYSELDDMSDSVKKFEPKLALFAKENGLYFYRKMIKSLDDVLNDGGKVFFEIGWKEKDDVIALVDKYWPKSKREVIKDINGNDRILYIDWVK